MPYPSPTGIEGPEDVPLDAANPAQFAAESFNEEYQLIGQQAEEQQNILNAEDEQVSEEQTAALQEEAAAMGQLPGEQNGENTYPEGEAANNGGGGTASDGGSGQAGNEGTPGSDYNSPINAPSSNDVARAEDNLKNLAGQYKAYGRPGAIGQLDTLNRAIIEPSGSQIEDSELGYVRCAEGFCMIQARDSNSLMFGEVGGINEMYVTQVRGEGPCSDFCQKYLPPASERFGPIRVWFGINKLGQGVVQFIDFVNGRIFGPFKP